MILAQRVGEAALAREKRLATAESCTGGLIAALCTAVSGSSAWFDCGFVTYSLDAKQKLLGVPAELLAAPGPVSEPVARAMAVGALARCSADMAVAVTGLAGPAGGEVDRPVGTVWLGWAMRDEGVPVIAQTSCFEYEGDRQAIRERAAETALEGLLTLLA